MREGLIQLSDSRGFHDGTMHVWESALGGHHHPLFASCRYHRLLRQPESVEEDAASAPWNAKSRFPAPGRQQPGDPAKLNNMSRKFHILDELAESLKVSMSQVRALIKREYIERMYKEQHNSPDRQRLPQYVRTLT